VVVTEGANRIIYAEKRPKLEFAIYRKPAQTDVILQNDSRLSGKQSAHILKKKRSKGN
jgi:hypothetical protein